MEIIDKVVNVKVKEIAPRPGDLVIGVEFSYPVCLLILDEKMDIIVKNQNDEVLENLNF